MTKIYLVRHGQASFGEKDYDNLSKLGLEQSYLLGQHFNHLNVKFDKIITGTLKRQIQTSNQIIDTANIKVKPQQTNLLNEYDQSIVQLLILSNLSESFRCILDNNIEDDKQHNKIVVYIMQKNLLY